MLALYYTLVYMYLVYSIYLLYMYLVDSSIISKDNSMIASGPLRAGRSCRMKA